MCVCGGVGCGVDLKKPLFSVHSKLFMPIELSKSVSDVGMEGKHCVLLLLIPGL